MNKPPKIYNFQGWQFDADNGELISQTHRAPLSPTDCKVLDFLIEHQGNFCTVDEILDGAWGQGVFIGENNVRQAITRIRKKLESLSLKLNGEEVIEGQKPKGYRFTLIPITAVLAMHDMPALSNGGCDAHERMEKQSGTVALPELTPVGPQEHSLLKDTINQQGKGDGQVSILWHVPGTPNPLFKGRENELQKLFEASQMSTQSRVVQVLAGLPGLGKTSIALEYAFRYRNRYSLVWWLDASSNTSLLKDYETLARQLKWKHTRHGINAMAYISRRLCKSNNWLLILDKASSADEVFPHLPKTDRGHIMITSSDRAWRGRAAVIDVPPLNMGLATEFLYERLKGLQPRVESDLMPSLASELGGIPYALELASAYLEATGSKITPYLKKIRAMRQKAFPITYQDSPEFAVAEAWELMVKRAQFISPAGIVLIWLTDYFDDCPIPLEFIEQLDKGAFDHWRSFPIRLSIVFLVRGLRRMDNFFIWLRAPFPWKIRKSSIPSVAFILWSRDEFSFAEALRTFQRYSVVQISEDGFTIPSAIKAQTRTRRFFWQQKLRCKRALAFATFFVREANRRHDREKAALWIRHLRKVMGHASALGITKEDETIQQAHLAIDESERKRSSHKKRSNKPIAQGPLPFREKIWLLPRFIGFMWKEEWPLTSAIVSCALSVIFALGAGLSVVYAKVHGEAPFYFTELAWFRRCTVIGIIFVISTAISLGFHRRRYPTPQDFYRKHPKNSSLSKRKK